MISVFDPTVKKIVKGNDRTEDPRWWWTGQMSVTLTKLDETGFTTKISENQPE